MSRLRILAAVGAVLVVASCSSKQAPSQPTTTDWEPMPAHGSLADCLKSNGVADTGGPAVVLGPPAGVDQATWDKAMKACASLAPGPAGP